MIDFIEECILDKDGFIEWVQQHCGNVYVLFEQYIRERVPNAHVTVSFDWLAYEPKHEFNEERGWLSSSHLPNWFKSWVHENTTGPSHTYWSKNENPIL